MEAMKTMYQNYLRFDKSADQFRHLAILHQVIVFNAYCQLMLLSTQTGFNQVHPLVIKIWKLSLALMIAQALCFTYRLYIAIVDDLGFSYIVCALMVVGGFASGGIRMAGLIHCYNDFREFQTHLQQGSSLLRNDSEAQRIRREHYENNQKFTLVMLSAGFGAITIWNLTDYRMTDQYRFPFDLGFLHPIAREIFETLYGFYLLALGSYFWIPFITIRVSLRALRAELLIMNLAFTKLFRNATENSQFLMNHLSSNSSTASQQADKLFWTCLQSEVLDLVRYHGLLLDNVFRVRRIASVPFLAEVFASISITSIAIFLFMLLRSESLVLVGISCIVMLESYYNSSLVEELEEAHLATSDTLYHLDWPTMMRYDPRFGKELKNVRKTMLIVMMRAQQRLSFHCGGMFEMSMHTFSVTVKTCYTILSFLMQVQEF